MFNYSDPFGTGLLDQVGAMPEYRTQVHSFYLTFARLSGSSFTLLDAFQGLPPTDFDNVLIDWKAFPVTAGGSDEDIDRDRFLGGFRNRGRQDEYVEWAVERNSANQITAITFTTEFPEYFYALATVSEDAIIEGIKEIYPNSQPSTEELFGPGFNPANATPLERGEQFLLQLPNNPWQNGKKGILCLQQGFNTMGALFNLVGQCSVTQPGSPGQACTFVGNACGENRSSDPKVCTASQNARRGSKVISLADPCGISITNLEGVWKNSNGPINISTDSNIWQLIRNNKRGKLIVTPDLKLDDVLINTGTQVSRVLRVGARVLTASENSVPAWTRTGQESSRMIS